MENLFFGIIIGVLGLGLMLIYQKLKRLQKQMIEVYRQTAANKNLAKNNFEQNLEQIKTLNAKYDREVEIFKKKFILRNDQIFARLDKLEKIPVPDHLSLTTQQIVNREVEKQMAERKDEQMNLLEITRQSELADYNREFHP